jgi:glycosyltransferase involved in cell wall biosynthesis
MIERITPLILTYNEAPNIGRTLAQLHWAKEIVVIDSYSDDETVEIVRSFSNTRLVQRVFDNHGAQWSFGLTETGISTEWVLALDADYLVTSELIEELETMPLRDAAGYQAEFTYCINGRPLRSGLLPGQVVLYRRCLAKYTQDGHTHRLLVEGLIGNLCSRILHDDRKPLRRWFESQQRYMALEAKKLLAAGGSGLSKADRVRRLRVVAPFAVLCYCLFVRGGVLDGWPGFYYAFQRMLAELVLSLYLLENDCGEKFGLRNANFEFKDKADRHGPIFLPLPLGEGRGEGIADASKPLSPALSQRERE